MVIKLKPLLKMKLDFFIFYINARSQLFKAGFKCEAARSFVTH